MRIGYIGLIVTVCSLSASACGGRQPGTGSANDEQEANQLLERARAEPSSDRYQRILSQFGSTHAASTARSEFTAWLLSATKDALAARDFHRADSSAEDAQRYGTVEQTQEARALLDRIDDERAAGIAEQAAELTGQEGGCSKALTLVAEPLRDKPRPRARFRDTLQTRSGPPLGECLGAEIEARYHEGALDAARALLATPDATIALAPDSYEKAVSRLRDLVAAHALEELGPMITARKWSAAIAEIGKRRDAGALEGKEGDAVLDQVRERMRADVLERVTAARASGRASREVESLQALVTLAGWNTVPADVTAALDAMRRSIECERLHCTPEAPVEVWAWGAIGVSPPAAGDGPPTQKLEHGQRVWRVAHGGARALIATENPGAARGAALLDMATGWVEAAKLRPADTAGWLPPPELLAGVRVWGPLRESVREHSFGIVTTADAKRATVRRMDDSLEITVDTRSLRLGSLPVGTKVLAFCADRMHAEPAKIDGEIVREGDTEKVKVVCDRGAISLLAMLSALSADPAWLPPRKP